MRSFVLKVVVAGKGGREFIQSMDDKYSAQVYKAQEIHYSGAGNQSDICSTMGVTFHLRSFKEPQNEEPHQLQMWRLSSADRFHPSGAVHLKHSSLVILSDADSDSNYIRRLKEEAEKQQIPVMSFQEFHAASNPIGDLVSQVAVIADSATQDEISQAFKLEEETDSPAPVSVKPPRQSSGRATLGGSMFSLFRQKKNNLHDVDPELQQERKENGNTLPNLSGVTNNML